jgi:hypothetical protein
MAIPAIEEVRSGLYLIRFAPDDIEKGEHTFHLRKCDYYSYTLVLQPCPEASQGTPSMLLSLIKSQQSNKMKTLPVGSNYLDLAKANQQDKNKVVDDQPRFVWIVPNGQQQQQQQSNKVTHLNLNASSEDLMMSHTKLNWGPVTCPIDKRFDLWMDFGTETLGEKKVLNQWASQLIKQENTDVEFNVQGELMGGHSPIIASGCSVFASMIQQQPTPKKPVKRTPSKAKGKSAAVSSAAIKVIQIGDVEPQVFQQILHYLYTGRIPLLEEEGMADRLFKAADKYGLDNLKDECARFVLADLNEHNVIDTLVWASKNSLANLFDCALHLVSANYPHVSSQPDWQNLIDNHPQIYLRVSQLMANLPGNARGT